jgi:8-oxo-dGTP pyrophosphatase MutT (NUDIX family)
MMRNFIEDLQTRWERGLPGRDFQYQMANDTRQIFKIRSAAADARKACVMALLIPNTENDWQIVLIERAKIEGDRHSGQISFPGGQLDADDASLADCALRELWEEVGVPKNKVTLIGQMTDLYIPVSNFQVFPFLGFCAEPVEFNPQVTEVQGILTPSIKHFLDKSNKKYKDIRINETVILQNVPYFDVEGRVVWGATAMMLSELAELVRTIGDANHG